MVKKKAIDELDPRQLKFVEEYVRTGNSLQSAITAGYSEKYAGQLSARMKHGKLEKVRRSLEEVYQEKGLTPELLVGSLVDDIKNKPGDRVQEIKHGSDLLGMVTKKVQIEDTSLPKLDEEKKSILAKLMG